MDGGTGHWAHSPTIAWLHSIAAAGARASLWSRCEGCRRGWVRERRRRCRGRPVASADWLATAPFSLNDTVMMTSVPTPSEVMKTIRMLGTWALHSHTLSLGLHLPEPISSCRALAVALPALCGQRGPVQRAPGVPSTARRLRRCRRCRRRFPFPSFSPPLYARPPSSHPRRLPSSSTRGGAAAACSGCGVGMFVSGRAALCARLAMGQKARGGRRRWASAASQATRQAICGQ